jgi:hypothetical protein
MRPAAPQADSLMKSPITVGPFSGGSAHRVSCPHCGFDPNRVNASSWGGQAIGATPSGVRDLLRVPGIGLYLNNILFVQITDPADRREHQGAKRSALRVGFLPIRFCLNLRMRAATAVGGAPPAGQAQVASRTRPSRFPFWLTRECDGVHGHACPPRRNSRGPFSPHGQEKAPVCTGAL